MYFGDIRLGDTIDLKFTTRRFSTGAPFTLAGTPVISAYPGNDIVQLTAGITLTVDFDGVTGLHSVRVVASGANGYVTAQNYALVITTGTVDAVSVVGEVIGSFSIEARSALMPTTAARTLDVAVGGEAGVDFDNTVGTLAKTTDITGFNDITAAAAADAVWDEASADHVAVGSVGERVERLDLIASGGAGGLTNARSVNLDNLDAAVTTRATPAQVNTEVLDVMNTDTFAEPGQESPPATTTLVKKLGYLYKFLRNRITVTATTISVFNDDATTVAQKSTHSDDATTYDRGEFATGP